MKDVKKMWKRAIFKLKLVHIIIANRRGFRVIFFSEKVTLTKLF